MHVESTTPPIIREKSILPAKVPLRVDNLERGLANFGISRRWCYERESFFRQGGKGSNYVWVEGTAVLNVECLGVMILIGGTGGNTNLECTPRHWKPGEVRRTKENWPLNLSNSAVSYVYLILIHHFCAGVLSATHVIIYQLFHQIFYIHREYRHHSRWPRTPPRRYTQNTLYSI